MSSEHKTLLAKVLSGLTADEITNAQLSDWPDVKPPEKKGMKPTAISTIKNVGHFLDRFGITIRDDAFRWVYLLDGVPMRTQLDDKTVLDFKFAMECCGLKIGKDTLWDALMAIAHLNTTHELRDLFEALEKEWDGKPRLDTWLADYVQVDDSPYTRAVASKPLIAAVRRVRRPGYAFKYMPVMEGVQDIRKSSVLRVLAFDKYFDDNLEFGASTKEIMEISSGVLIHEVPELSKMANKQVETVKAMMSRQRDKARMAYGRTTTEMPRQFILWGTSNDRQYLKDATGSVRFWPFWSSATLEKPIDTEGLAKQVRQIWAEAAHRERHGESVYLEGEALRLAQIEQDARFAGDDNYDALADTLEGKEGFLTSGAVYQICQIVDDRVQRSPMTAASIHRAMTKLGWQKGKRRVKGSDGKSKQLRGWVKNCPEGRAIHAYWDYEPADGRLKATPRAA